MGGTVLAGAMCALFGVPAAAQDAPPSDAQSEATEADQGNAILVTARRREETLQETPVAISAFSAETLAERQIQQTQDLERITPSLQFKPAGQLSGNSSASVAFIRGVGQLDPTAAVDPGVGVYIDEPRTDFATLARSFDVEGIGPLIEPEEIKPALERAVDATMEGRPVLVDVHSRRGRGGGG